MWNAVGVILFTSSSLNCSRVFYSKYKRIIKYKDIFRYKGTTKKKCPKSLGD